MNSPVISRPDIALDRIQKIRQALIDRNYRRIADFPLPLAENLSIWNDGWNAVVLHEYRQGMGFELYVQSTTKNDMQAVIDAIPVGNHDAAVRRISMTRAEIAALRSVVDDCDTNTSDAITIQGLLDREVSEVQS